ncbi:hypothetical protein JXB27_03525 [Candidatus Woesearchaeota archaeon]|nr:hypothetical protein [Candidatus Woesearchaeota archaeon]
MVTFLEGSLLRPFDTFFAFLFILVAVYAILNKTKIFGENSFTNGILAGAVAVLAAMSNTVTKTVAYATPWLVFLLVIVLFLMLIMTFLGADEKSFFLNPSDTTAVSIIAALVIIIFILAVGEVREDERQEAAESGENSVLSFPTRVGETLRSPVVIGLVITLLIALFTVLMLSAVPKK